MGSIFLRRWEYAPRREGENGWDGTRLRAYGTAKRRGKVFPSREEAARRGVHRRIRTPAGFYTPTCFQDTPLQPLEYIRIWSTWRGTISQQPDWKSGTLPIELHVHIRSAPKFFQSEEIFTWRCITVSWMTSPHTDFPLLKISPYQCPVSRLSPLPRHWLRMPLRYYYCCLKVVKQ